MLNRQPVFCSKNGLCLPIACFTPMRSPRIMQSSYRKLLKTSHWLLINLRLHILSQP